MKQMNADFGWRYKGRWVGVYRDLSREGTPDNSVNNSRKEKDRTLTCLQCGICTAACHLAKDNNVFPRREMSLVQGGLEDRAVTLPSIWHCYQCDDCTQGCPSLAGPSEVMAQLRAKAITEFSILPDFAKWLNTPKGFAFFFGFVLLLIGILGIIFSDHVWDRDAVVYKAMYPHRLLIPFFSLLTLLSFALTGISLAKAWRTWCGYAPAIRRLKSSVFWLSTLQAITETIAHSRFAACETKRYRRLAHILIIAGFSGLCGVAFAAAIAPLTNANPDSLQKPFTLFKIFANIFSTCLILGIGLFLVYRLSTLSDKTAVAFEDWVFPSLMLAIVFSGLFSQWARWANVGVIAYPVYVFHLSSVFVLIATLPFAKPAHALYRLAAEIHRIALERSVMLNASDVFFNPNKIQQRFGENTDVENSKAVDMCLVKDAPFLLCHEDAKNIADTVIIDTYNTLRDSYRKVNGEKLFYNIENLYGTAFEREKDRRELRRRQKSNDSGELPGWYEEAAGNTCTWWLENQLLARHSLRSCMFCGMCTAVCPAAEHYEEYNPRSIVDAALSGKEEEIIALLKADTIWYCGQCGSCKERCPRGNSIMGLISSLRILAQLKGYHLYSARGRQQYASRYLWGSNFWNRGCSLYFRNCDKWAHPDFGPNYEKFFDHQEQEFLRLGANPDRPGMFGGRKVNTETLEELRSLVEAGGTIALWKKVDDFGNSHRSELKLTEEAYLEMVAKEG
ncbi:MAG: 4Fe-4S dicluster domain-containing protein [Deltaproteobacteria bacterium]|nr:4Fe-4S dicluster domain-containing protein [Deltaproteobacteria bacterium]